MLRLHEYPTDVICDAVTLRAVSMHGSRIKYWRIVARILIFRNRQYSIMVNRLMEEMSADWMERHPQS